MFSWSFPAKRIWQIDADLFGRHWFGWHSCNGYWTIGFHIGPCLKFWSGEPRKQRMNPAQVQ